MNRRIWIDLPLILSLIAFVVCLFSSAFYVDVTRDPIASIRLFLAGTVGIGAIHIPWVANPLYFVALVKHIKKPHTSVLLCALALCFALTFLGYDEFQVRLQGVASPITGIGAGYFLWLIAIVLLLVSSMAKNKQSTGIEKTFMVSILSATIALSIYFYYFNEDSHYRFKAARELAFQSVCEQAGEQTYIDIDQSIVGIYFDTVGTKRYSIVAEGRYGSSGGSMVNSRGLTSFEYFERENFGRDSTTPYLREYTGRPARREEVDELESEITVRTTSLSDNFPPAYGITSEHIQILFSATGDLIAETKYAALRSGARFCGAEVGETYDAMTFVIDVLNLTD